MEWIWQMINILMGTFGVVIIYQRRAAFLVFYFYTLLFIIVLMISWTAYNFTTQILTVKERMSLKLDEIKETDEMYVTQKKLSCCEEKDIAENKLNSLTGSCCGKENNEVCANINDVFQRSCLPSMIQENQKNLYVRLSLAIVQESLLFFTSISSILLNVSLKKEEPQQKEREAE